MPIVPEVDILNPPEDSVDTGLSLAERKPRRQVQIPKRYQDNPPQASPALPLPSYARPREDIREGANSTSGSLSMPGNCVDKEPGPRSVLRTPCNVFGLLRCYYNT